jgi:transposase-like protein
MKHAKPKLEIKTRRIFSEEFKRSKVEELIQKRITIRQLSKFYEVSPSAVYSWLYKYSVHYEQRSKLVVEMESESYRTQQLLQRVAELERIIGQKQLEVDFLNKLLEIGSEELGFDLKKNFSTKLSSGTGGSAGGEGSK